MSAVVYYEVSGVSLTELDDWYDSLVPPKTAWMTWLPCNNQKGLDGPDGDEQVGVQRWWYTGKAGLDMFTSTFSHGSLLIGLQPVKDSAYNCQ